MEDFMDKEGLLRKIDCVSFMIIEGKTVPSRRASSGEYNFSHFCIGTLAIANVQLVERNSELSHPHPHLVLI